MIDRWVNHVRNWENISKNIKERRNKMAIEKVKIWNKWNKERWCSLCIIKLIIRVRDIDRYLVELKLRNNFKQ